MNGQDKVSCLPMSSVGCFAIGDSQQHARGEVAPIRRTGICRHCTFCATKLHAGRRREGSRRANAGHNSRRFAHGRILTGGSRLSVQFVTHPDIHGFIKAENVDISLAHAPLPAVLRGLHGRAGADRQPPDAFRCEGLPADEKLRRIIAMRTANVLELEKFCAPGSVPAAEADREHRPDCSSQRAA